MKTNKAVGLDKIGARLLKDSVDVITPSLTNLEIIVNFNKILETLIFQRSYAQIYKQHENDKKRLYTQRVMNVEQGTFTPLVFTTTGGMGEECKRYHNRLAELVAAKKGEVYANTVSWIRSKVSFAILRAALLCLRGSRTPKRTIRSNVQEADFELDRFRAKI